MSKHNGVNNQSEHSEFNFSEMIDSLYDNEMISEMMVNLMETGESQTRSAIELTKLAVEKHSGEMTPEKILSIFEQFLNTISEDSSLKKLWIRFLKD